MLTIVVPALDEAQGIGSTLDELQASLAAAGLESEVIVVDDGSTDGTGAIATRAGVTVIRHAVSLGYGRSLKDGILRARGDVIAIADADGSYPVHEIPRLVKAAEGLDMLVGARTGPAYRGSFAKLPARKLFQWLVEWSVGQRIPDVNSGLRVMRRDAVLRFVPTLSNGFSFTTTLTMAMLLNAYAVAWTPIAYAERKGRSKIRPVRDTLRTAQVVVESMLYYNPIKLFLLPASLLAGAGVATGAWDLARSASIGASGAVLVVGAFLVFSLGLVADVLRRILDGVANRGSGGSRDAR